MYTFSQCSDDEMARPLSRDRGLRYKPVHQTQVSGLIICKLQLADRDVQRARKPLIRWSG